jgi:hypothetical protein
MAKAAARHKPNGRSRPARAHRPAAPAPVVLPTSKALDPNSDSSGGFNVAPLIGGMGRQTLFTDYGSYGLRQYGGWIREEILPELTGREAARAYREMLDNSAVVGAMIFTIQQAMRKVKWRMAPADEKNAESVAAAEFAESLRHDMSHTWDDALTEILSMLPFGFSVHEIVYKYRLGKRPRRAADDMVDPPSSKYDDGLIGWRRLPIRGQETIIKWFFDRNGQIRGVTQQPWVGSLLDIPVEKFLLFRPTQHKNNPEGRSVLRNAYRSYYFMKRMEELEAILFERMGGLPVMYVPSSLLDKAASTANTPDVRQAQATVAEYKSIATRTRINDQMGAVLPSDPYKDMEGKPTSVRMYELKLVTPERGRMTVDSDKIIQRHTVQILMTLLADFIKLGHEVRGTNNLAVTRVDMFYAAIEGWLHSIASVFNRFGFPRVFEVNAMAEDLVPTLEPDMPQRLDLDSLGAFIKNVAGSGMLMPDAELEEFIRDAAGFPAVENPDASPEIQRGRFGSGDIVKMLMGAFARAAKAQRNGLKHGTEANAN